MLSVLLRIDTRLNQCRAFIGFRGNLEMNAEGICKKVILTSYSSYEVLLNIWTLIEYLQYMSGQSEYQTPSLRLQQQKLIFSMEYSNSIGFWTSLFRGQLSFPEISKGLIQNTLQSTLEISAFFVQFLQVWNTERPNYSFDALPQIEPPPYDDKANSFQGRCPLCLQKWKIPTVLPVSGYVYCFPCIIRYLREHQKCPVTELPTKQLEIIRLYDGD